jgi:hypothetical protein
MRSIFSKLVMLGAMSMLLAPLAAQEGHPLKGSWIGVWEGNTIHGEFVLLVLDWDGEQVTGVINPGTDDMTIDEVRLDPDDWSVHVEARGQDRDGKALNYVVDGKIEELELPNRAIIGSWRNERERGRFEIRRQ